MKHILGLELCNSLNSNQFGQTVIKGQRDLSVSMGGKILTGVVSQSQATAMVPGQRVKLDNTAGIGVLSFVAAAVTDVAIGVIGYQTNKSSFTKGNAIDVLSLGSVYYAEVAVALSAGVTVEGVAGQTVQLANASKKHGVALDAGAAGDLVRVMIIEPVIGA